MRGVTSRGGVGLITFHELTLSILSGFAPLCIKSSTISVYPFIAAFMRDVLSS